MKQEKKAMTHDEAVETLNSIKTLPDGWEFASVSMLCSCNHSGRMIYIKEDGELNIHLVGINVDVDATQVADYAALLTHATIEGNFEAFAPLTEERAVELAEALDYESDPCCYYEYMLTIASLVLKANGFTKLAKALQS